MTALEPDAQMERLVAQTIQRCMVSHLSQTIKSARMDDAFPFLTKDDLRLVAERIRRMVYQEDEMILQEGSRRQSLFIVRSGLVRVEQAAREAVVLAHLKPGEVFGEMSFLESLGASASIVADEPTEIGVVEGIYLQSLLASVPGFSSRFFQSLAVNLARRLRERTNARVIATESV